MEANKSVGGLISWPGIRMVVNEPSMNAGAILRHNPNIFERHPLICRAPEAVRVGSRRALRPWRRGHVKDGALTRNQDYQEHERQSEQQLHEAHKAPQQQPKLPEWKACLFLIVTVALRL